MLILAGAGPGHPKYLTQEVGNLIKNCPRVLAFPRVAQGLEAIRADIEPINSISDLEELLKEDIDTLLLASGDPGFYGILDYLKRKNIQISRVEPGLSSFQYLCARLGKSWQEAVLFSLHGREDDLEKLLDKSLSITLLDSKSRPSLISKRLYELGLRGRLHVGFNLSYEDERIISCKIGDEIENHSSLALMVIENALD